MLRRILVMLTVSMLVLMSVAQGWSEVKVLSMSTTTSTLSSGLLDILVPEFERGSGIKVKVIAKGTGAAIRDGQDGNVDLIFVHAKGRETAFVNDGYGTERFAVMHNDFVLLGPAPDPAEIKGKESVAAALGSIAKAQATFVSRGDDSGTHTKEQALWENSGVELQVAEQTIIKKGEKTKIRSQKPVHSENWYVSIGQGMGKVITYADEKQAYTLADRGTYIKYKYGKKPAIELDVLSEGDTTLANPYGIIPVNPEKHPHVQYDMAMQFVHWITGAHAQKLIADYRLEGKQLFYPDAK